MKNLNKSLYLTLKIHNLSAMNDLYSFQGTCLLCKVLENWSEKIHKICWLIPQKRNSAGALNGCIAKNVESHSFSANKQGSSSNV